MLHEQGAVVAKSGTRAWHLLSTAKVQDGEVASSDALLDGATARFAASRIAVGEVRSTAEPPSMDGGPARNPHARERLRPRLGRSVELRRDARLQH
jgi:hypothetical protein